MKTILLFAAIFLNHAAFAGQVTTLTIEPSEAFTEAVRLGMDLAKKEFGVPHALIHGQLELHRGKYLFEDFGDFSVRLNIENPGFMDRAECTVAVTIARVPFAKQQDIVLETDFKNHLETIAKVRKVNCVRN